MESVETIDECTSHDTSRNVILQETLQYIGSQKDIKYKVKDFNSSSSDDINDSTSFFCNKNSFIEEDSPAKESYSKCSVEEFSFSLSQLVVSTNDVSLLINNAEKRRKSMCSTPI